jgi:hypothetical protein
MKRKIANLLLLTVIFSLLFSLTGCLTTEDKRELELFKENAAKYYHAKYGESPQIESYGYYVNSNNLFPHRTDHKYAKCADKTIIFYDAGLNRMVDNKQSNEVSFAIEKELLAQMDQVTALIPDSRLIVLDCCSSAYAADYEGNFYHTYYDGNIDAFFESEDVQLTANICLLCNKDDPWADAQRKCENIIRENFCINQAVTLTILSEECCYEKFGAARINDLRCYAKYIMHATSTDAYIQNFIKIADGIYATCAEKNFILEDGDIIAVEAMSEEELNAAIFAQYENLPDKTGKTYSVASAALPIYRFVFSDRIKDKFSNGNLGVYLMYAPEEVTAAETDQLLEYETKDAFFRRLTGNDALGAPWVSINEENCYFIGSFVNQTDAENSEDDTLDALSDANLVSTPVGTEQVNVA